MEQAKSGLSNPNYGSEAMAQKEASVLEDFINRIERANGNYFDLKNRLFQVTNKLSVEPPSEKMPQNMTDKPKCIAEGTLARLEGLINEYNSIIDAHSGLMLKLEGLL